MRKWHKYMLMVCVITLMLTPLRVLATDSHDAYIEEKGEEFKRMLHLLTEQYAGDEVHKEVLFKAAMDGMFEELDTYSTFYTKNQKEAFIEAVSGEFVGIGVYMELDGDYPKIQQPLPKSPALKAGVKPEDLIIAINGESTKGLSLNEVASKVKGKEGTQVNITFRRGEDEFTLELTRQLIKISAVESEDIQTLFPSLSDSKARQINYIKVNSINENVATDMVPYVEKAKKKGVKYLILDLRDNLGGYVDTGVDLCNLLTPKGPVLHFINKEGRKRTYRSELEKAPFELVVLTNENTASASEFIAAAVKESGIGVTVGETTYGKGVAQYIWNFSSDYAFKLTMEEFLSRDGNKINEIGVAPDYEVIVPNLIVSPERLFLDDEMEEVKDVELILDYLGYDINKPDLIYDQKTERAITKFQETYKLRAYGVTDYPTLEMLNEKLVERINEKDIQLEKALDVILSKMNKN